MIYSMSTRYAKRVELLAQCESGVEILTNWTEVRTRSHMNLPPGGRSAMMPEIRKWVDQHASDLWACYINRYYFKNPRDAVMFALRWP